MAKIGPKEAQRRALREAAPFKRGDIVMVSGKPARITAVVAGPSGTAEEIIDRNSRTIAKLLKRGRPALDLTPEQRTERKRQQTRKRVQKHRAKRKK